MGAAEDRAMTRRYNANKFAVGFVERDVKRDTRRGKLTKPKSQHSKSVLKHKTEEGPNWNAPWLYSAYEYDAPKKVWTFDGKIVPRNDLPPKLYDDDDNDPDMVGGGKGPQPVWAGGAPTSTYGYKWDNKNKVWTWDGHVVPLEYLPSDLWDDNFITKGRGKGASLKGPSAWDDIWSGIKDVGLIGMKIADFSADPFGIVSKITGKEDPLNAFVEKELEKK